MQWNDIISLGVAALGVVAAFGSWRAAGRAADASDKAAEVADRSEQRAIAERNFLEYERHTLALANAKAEAAILLARCRRRESEVLSKAMFVGAGTSSRVTLIITEVQRLTAAVSECADLLEAASGERPASLQGADLVADFQHTRLLVERMRVRLQQLASELALADFSVNSQ
jgi:hypothetical protein